MKKFYCTRPALTSVLMENGYTPQIVPNPYKIGWSIWVFPLDDDVCRISKKFYTEIGAPLPKAIKYYMDGGNTNE